MDAISVIAKFIVDTTYERLPNYVVEVVKKQITDTVGVALAGSAQAGISELRDIVKDWGGKEESTIWVYGDKLPCVSAAEVNAAMVHALDWDDTHDAALIHPSVATVPTGLAIAERLERLGRIIDGKELITAVALGNEFSTRLSLAPTVSMFERGWHYTTLHGCFSATAVAGKLLGLNQEELVNAFGLAYHQASGNLQCIHDGALAKRVGPSFSVRNGIMAALMAQKGITGARGVLEGVDGLFNVYHRADYNLEVLTKDLGKRFENTNVSFKLYPCCRNNHPSIDATLALVRERNIKADDVASATIHVGEGALNLLGLPLSTKRNPKTIVDAQFSLQWTVASAIAHREVTLDDFTPKAIKDSAVLALSNRITPELCEDVNVKGLSPAIVYIKTKGGEMYSKRVDFPVGSPENPLSMDALIGQLRDCASHAAKPLSSGNVEKLIQMVPQIDTVSDVVQVARLLA